MTRNEILSYNAGVNALAQIATASADALNERITVAPTRYGFAIGALEGIAEAAHNLLQPLPPSNEEEASDAC